jgi:hypothetical protein
MKKPSQQQQILNALADYLPTVIPIYWEVVPVRDLRMLSENLDNVVLIMPRGISWARPTKGRVSARHIVNLVFIRRIGGDVDQTIDLIDALARRLLLNEPTDGPLDEFPCMEAETIDGADAGFDMDELTKSPATFYGGLQLTFWAD